MTLLEISTAQGPVLVDLSTGRTFAYPSPTDATKTVIVPAPSEFARTQITADETYAALKARLSAGGATLIAAATASAV